MRSLSSVGLVLSLVFGCLLLALVAELYYLLWWKKKITNREIEGDYSSPASEFLYMFCWKKPSSLSSTALNPQDTHVHEPQDLFSSKDLWPKTFDEDDEDVVGAELMRLQSLSAPPRFLFTIKEETWEDLESEDGKSSRVGKSMEGSRSRRSLSDLLLTVETPFLTPLASPSCFTPPLTPLDSSHHHYGFNPLFEESTDAEFNKIRSSPPPKFKFLKDAEEKLYRRKQMEEIEKDVRKSKIDGSVQEEGSRAPPSTSVFLKDEENNGSFITLIVDKNRGTDLNHPHHNRSQYNSSSSQVLPLASSPSTFRPPTHKRPISR